MSDSDFELKGFLAKGVRKPGRYYTFDEWYELGYHVILGERHEIRARIDTFTKNRATEALEAMGLSLSDAIRLLLLRVADERRLPFEVRAPNATTRRAMAEAESLVGAKPDSSEG
jgi:DNA-damage-inducible protein J